MEALASLGIQIILGPLTPMLNRQFFGRIYTKYRKEGRKARCYLLGNLIFFRHFRKFFFRFDKPKSCSQWTEGKSVLMLGQRNNSIVKAINARHDEQVQNKNNVSSHYFSIGREETLFPSFLILTYTQLWVWIPRCAKLFRSIAGKQRR